MTAMGGGGPPKPGWRQTEGDQLGGARMLGKLSGGGGWEARAPSIC